MIVPAKGISEIGSRMSIQIRPTAYAGVDAIGSYYPPRADLALPELDFLVGDPRDYALPKKIDPQFSSTFGHDAMQRSSANREATGAGWEIRLRRQPGTEKAHAANRTALSHRHHNSQPFQRRDRVRHQRFPASLVNRRFGAVGHHYP